MSAATPKSEQIEVAPGQVWADNDPRSRGRTLKVISVGKQSVRCEVLTVAPHVRRGVGTVTMIARHRFRPTSNGYRLVEQP